MDIKMQAEYSGYVLKWNDWDRDFEISKDGVDVKKGVKSLEDCQKWIDQKNKQKFRRVAVLCEFGWREGIKKAEATSIVEGEYVWVTNGKNRSKVKMSDCITDTKPNREALETVNGKRKEIKALEGQISEIMAATERLTADMMTGEAEGCEDT